MSKSGSDADTEDEEAKVEALKAFDFGQLIAFVLPGLVATRGLALLLPTLDAAFVKITTGGEGALGPLVWLLIVGATAGLTISVSRQQWLDPIFGWIYSDEHGPWRVNYAALKKDEKAQALYAQAVSNVYRYYQFIANMAIALALAAGILWRAAFIAPSPPSGATPPYEGLKWVTAILSAFLLVTAYQQFKGWCRVHNPITSDVESKGTSDAAAPAGASSSANAPARPST